MSAFSERMRMRKRAVQFGDETIAALQSRADGNAESCRELMRRMRIIHDNTTEPAIRQVAWDALRMSWLIEPEASSS